MFAMVSCHEWGGSPALPPPASVGLPFIDTVRSPPWGHAAASLRAGPGWGQLLVPVPGGGPPAGRQAHTGVPESSSGTTLCCPPEPPSQQSPPRCAVDARAGSLQEAAADAPSRSSAPRAEAGSRTVRSSGRGRRGSSYLRRRGSGERPSAGEGRERRVFSLEVQIWVWPFSSPPTVTVQQQDTPKTPR